MLKLFHLLLKLARIQTCALCGAVLDVEASTRCGQCHHHFQTAQSVPRRDDTF